MVSYDETMVPICIKVGQCHALSKSVDTSRKVSMSFQPVSRHWNVSVSHTNTNPPLYYMGWGEVITIATDQNNKHLCILCNFYKVKLICFLLDYFILKTNKLTY
jgi:hypothetical protein